jgi:hypothetical protein
MFSARHPPIAGARLPSFCKPRRLGKIHVNSIASTSSRWQSTESASAKRPEQFPHDRRGPKPAQARWGTGRVLLLTAASGGLAYAVATLKEKNRKVNRDYSDPLKFVEPKYASVKDMELVSLRWTIWKMDVMTFEF